MHFGVYLIFSKSPIETMKEEKVGERDAESKMTYSSKATLQIDDSTFQNLWRKLSALHITFKNLPGALCAVDIRKQPYRFQSVC